MPGFQARTTTFIAAGLALLAVAFALACDGIAGDGAPPAGDDALAIVGVSVVPMDRERVVADRTVVVRDGRIERMGPAGEVEVPDDALRIDGAGRYLMPGLAEMHAHVPSGEGREFMERVLFLYLSNGITTIRGMLGAPVHLEVREEIESGELLAPRFYTSGPSLNGNSIPGPDSARRAVRHQVEAGYDFLKIHPGLSRETYDAMVEEARERGIEWAGHVPRNVGLERALEAGQATIDHLDGYARLMVEEGADVSGREPIFFGYHLADAFDESKIPALARRTREAGVWNVPTQSLIEHVFGPTPPEELARRPEMRYLPPEMVEGWAEAKRRRMSIPQYSEERSRAFIDSRRKLIADLRDAGARLLLGSDAPQLFQVPGFVIRDELRIYVESGLTPYEALLTGTRNVAEFFGDGDEYGTVTEGKVADLILVEGNPLEDVAHAFDRAGIVVRGRWLPEEEVQRRLEEIAAAYDEGG